MFRPAIRRRACAAGCGTAAVALACVLLAPSSRATGQAPSGQPASGQPASGQPASGQPQSGQAESGQPPRPTFRLDASYVRVDVYPTRGGAPVPDLALADFELLEDGKPQKIEQFERVSLDATAARTERRDPNTVAESRAQAMDPRRRVFVVFLDTGMTVLEASHAARKPIVDLLNRLIGDEDLYAVMTPEMSASGITFARRTEALDADLARHWTWGQRDALVRRDPEEASIEMCFPDPAPERYCTSPDGKKVVQPANAYRGVAQQLIERRAEKRTLEALDDLSAVLGSIREERKAVIVVSQGWRLLEPKPALTRLQECDQPALPGLPGTNPVGRVVADAGSSRDARGVATPSQCNAYAVEYANVDNASSFRYLIERANRFNVSFYPFDTRGLAVFDRSIGARDDRIRNDPGERSDLGRGPRGPLSGDMDRTVNRVESLRTMAEATDGLAVVNTNDLDGGARRIANDLSTYYLLGYQSTNTKLDGKWRDITVRIKAPGVQVRARKGYRALTEKDLALLGRGGAPGNAAGTPGTTAPGPAAAGAAAMSSVIAPLAGIDRALPWRSRVAWRAGAAEAGRARFWIASEIDEATLRQPDWAGGGTWTATLARADGTRITDATLKLEAGARAVEASLDADVPQGADVMVRLRLTPTSGGLPLSDTIRFTPASTMNGRLFRRGPTTGLRFVAAGDPRFRRTDRVRVALPVEDASLATEATLLDRAGNALKVPVAARVETIDGGPWAVGELALAPLSPGDYVIRLVLGQGDRAQTTLTGIRIVN